MESVNVVLWFDVEDYITPESDEALLRIIEILDKLDIPGVFKLVGEKARKLVENGRQDIIQLLKHHDIGFHTDLHSHHPTVSEYLEPLGFHEGALQFETMERRGMDSLKAIFNVDPICYGQPGYSWAPQVFPVLKYWGVPLYLDDHDIVQLDGRPFWYGGLLNLTSLTNTFRMELNDHGLEDAISRFDEIYRSVSASGGFVSIFYHDCEFVTSQFWDACNFANGVNTPPTDWHKPPLRSLEETDCYFKRFEEFLAHMKNKPDTRFVTVNDILSSEQSSKKTLNSDHIRALARNVGNSLSFAVFEKYSVSASDLFISFYEYLLRKPFGSSILYGPEHHVPSDVMSQVSVRDVINSIDLAEFPRVFNYAHLPNTFSVSGRLVNPVDMTCTLAQIIARGLSEDDDVDIVHGELESTKFVRRTEYWGHRWVIFPPDFRAKGLVLTAMNQAWTLKPAVF